MDTTTKMKPKTMAELLPELRGILCKDSMQILTAKKQPRSESRLPRQTIAQNCTAEKFKPRTLAEMRADILGQSSKKEQAATTSKKKNWNSSVKIDKTVSHTANGKMKNNPVRKVLNFQPKLKPASSIRTTMGPASPKFPKPGFKPKKSLFLLQARNNVRISGINNIAETPVVDKPVNSRMTRGNKENVVPSIKKFPPPPLVPMSPSFKKNVIRAVPDTPLSNESWRSSCDASFLQNEKQVNDVEEKIKALSDKTVENIAEITPPASTPFKNYRNVKEFFSISSEMESSAFCHDNTIMCFDKQLSCKENSKREESVIVSLCDQLNKATVENSEKIKTELDEVISQLEKKVEYSLKKIDRIKEEQLSCLQYIRKLKTLTKETSKDMKIEEFSPEREPVINKPCSVIKSSAKSPSYRIPKKNLCWRKKVLYKSMPNVSNDVTTPLKADMGDRALSMYMRLKENMDFLKTPVSKRDFHVQDTPAVTSHNLQKQLDKLYDEN